MREALITFALSCAMSFVAMSARFGLQLTNDPPPDDKEQFAVWRRKRFWTVLGELSTIPAMGAGWTAAAIHWQFSVPVIVGGAMVCGAVGFGFLLAALQALLTRKLEHV